jgi:hypothetical protein
MKASQDLTKYMRSLKEGSIAMSKDNGLSLKAVFEKHLIRIGKIESDLTEGKMSAFGFNLLLQVIVEECKEEIRSLYLPTDVALALLQPFANCYSELNWDLNPGMSAHTSGGASKKRKAENHTQLKSSTSSSSSSSSSSPKSRSLRLLALTKAGQANKVRELLKDLRLGDDIDVRHEDENGMNALEIAIFNKSIPMIKALLDNVPDCLNEGFDVDAPYCRKSHSLIVETERSISSAAAELLSNYSTKILYNEEEAESEEEDESDDESSAKQSDDPRSSNMFQPAQKKRVIRESGATLC